MKCTKKKIFYRSDYRWSSNYSCLCICTQIPRSDTRHRTYFPPFYLQFCLHSSQQDSSIKTKTIQAEVKNVLHIEGDRLVFANNNEDLAEVNRWKSTRLDRNERQKDFFSLGFVLRMRIFHLFREETSASCSLEINKTEVQRKKIHGNHLERWARLSSELLTEYPCVRRSIWISESFFPRKKRSSRNAPMQMRPLKWSMKPFQR